jgi:hypothetical protein
MAEYVISARADEDLVSIYGYSYRLFGRSPPSPVSCHAPVIAEFSFRYTVDMTAELIAISVIASTPVYSTCSNQP